jgi:hypothetical protein
MVEREKRLKPWGFTRNSDGERFSIVSVMYVDERIPAYVGSSCQVVSRNGRLQVVDVVLVTQESLSRGHWRLGRVLEIYPGRDGHDRAAQVQCMHVPKRL